MLLIKLFFFLCEYLTPDDNLTRRLKELENERKKPTDDGS